MKIILFALALVLGAYIGKSQSMRDSVIFNTSMEKYKYLRYLYFLNEFDSATVSFYFGEVTVRSNSTILQVPLTDSLSNYKTFRGDSLQGENANLLSLARTAAFTMPPGSVTADYFAELRALAPCGSSSKTAWKGIESGFAEQSQNRWNITYNPIWDIGVGAIQDHTEFSIQLVRVSDNSIIKELGRFGIEPNPNGSYALYYPEDANAQMHHVTIGSEYAGQNVYVRVSPRRWGPTPYGVRMSAMPMDMNKSFRSGNFKNSLLAAQLDFTHSERDSLQKWYYDDLFVYFDSIVVETGYLPPFYTRYNFPSKEFYDYLDRYHERYFVVDTIIQGDTLWRQKNQLTSSAKINKQIQNTLSKAHYRFYFKMLSKHPVTEQNIDVVANMPFESKNADIWQVNLQGDYERLLWRGTLQRGENLIHLEMGATPSGERMLCFADHDNSYNTCLFITFIR